MISNFCTFSSFNSWSLFFFKPFKPCGRVHSVWGRVYADLILNKQWGDAWPEALRVLEWMERDDLKADELLGSCLAVCCSCLTMAFLGAKKGKTLIHLPNRHSTNTLPFWRSNGCHVRSEFLLALLLSFRFRVSEEIHFLYQFFGSGPMANVLLSWVSKCGILGWS